LIDVTLHLRSPLGAPVQSFHYKFRLDYEWYSGTLSNVRNSGMLLVIINMGVAGGYAHGYMSYAHAP